MNESIHIDEMTAVVEDYIYRMKGIKVRITQLYINSLMVRPQHIRALHYAYEYIKSIEDKTTTQ